MNSKAHDWTITTEGARRNVGYVNMTATMTVNASRGREVGFMGEVRGSETGRFAKLVKAPCAGPHFEALEPSPPGHPSTSSRASAPACTRGLRLASRPRVFEQSWAGRSSTVRRHLRHPSFYEGLCESPKDNVVELTASSALLKDHRVCQSFGHRLRDHRAPTSPEPCSRPSRRPFCVSSSMLEKYERGRRFGQERRDLIGLDVGTVEANTVELSVQEP